MIRLFDMALSLIGLSVASPLIALAMVAVFVSDGGSPIYAATRVGRDGRLFRMYKIRTMVIDAEKKGGSSTSNLDRRITHVGRWLRKFKLDELIQLWNVLKGDMSLVGPRPNVKEGGTELYTEEEKKLLSSAPGITDLASIVFSDEGSILAGSEDPDREYNRVIRPWKSRLALLYVQNKTPVLYMKIIVCTVLSMVSRAAALRIVARLIARLGADAELVAIASRKRPLYAFPPPGADKIAG